MSQVPQSFSNHFHIDYRKFTFTTIGRPIVIKPLILAITNTFPYFYELLTKNLP